MEVEQKFERVVKYDFAVGKGFLYIGCLCIALLLHTGFFYLSSLFYNFNMNTYYINLGHIITLLSVLLGVFTLIIIFVGFMERKVYWRKIK